VFAYVNDVSFVSTTVSRRRWEVGGASCLGEWGACDSGESECRKQSGGRVGRFSSLSGHDTNTITFGVYFGLYFHDEWNEWMKYEVDHKRVPRYAKFWVQYLITISILLPSNWKSFFGNLTLLLRYEWPDYAFCRSARGRQLEIGLMEKAGTVYSGWDHWGGHSGYRSTYALLKDMDISIVHERLGK